MFNTSAGVPGSWLPKVTVAFALCLVVLIGVVDAGWFRSEVLRAVAAVPGGDKSLHFLLVGGMALLLNWSWGAAHWRAGPLRIQQGSVVVALVCTLEELSQLFVRARAFDLEDLAYDYAGILLLGQLGAGLHAIGRRRAARGSSRGP